MLHLKSKPWGLLGRHLQPLRPPLVALLAMALAACVAPQESPIVRIDHVMIRTSQPSVLLSLFVDVFQLPIAWPLENRGGVNSGAVSFGNVNVEAIQFPDQALLETKLVGFGLEPIPLVSALAELDRRGVRYGVPRPFEVTGQDGVRRHLWTNVTLSDLSDADRPATATMHIFLSEYSPSYVDVAERREQLRAELSANGGGPLGIRSVSEIVIGSNDLERARESWGQVLSPSRPSRSDAWPLGDGPSIRLVSADQNALLGFVVNVVSLDRARAFLRENNMLGTSAETSIAVAPAVVGGISLRFTEAR
jgi:hypothetical protein